MTRGTASRRWLLAWVIFLGFMFLSAWTVREARYSALGRSITRELTPYAEQGIETKHFDANGNLLYTDNEYLWENQGPMVWLIEHGHRDPAMLRVMLLCEARRTVDEVYLYPDCYNWDLREHLIAECLKAFPDDPLVHWATGRCLLAAGEYEQAAVELVAAQRLRFDPAAAGVSAEHFKLRIITALIMNGMPDGAIEYAADIVDSDLAAENYWIYADLLCRLEKYRESSSAVEEALQLYPSSTGLLGILLRCQWWQGDLSGMENSLTRIHRRDRLALNDVVYRGANRLSIATNSPEDIAAELFYCGNPFILQWIAEHYAISGQDSILSLLEEQIALQTITISDNQHSSKESFYKLWIDYARLTIIRAFVLAHQWDKLDSALAETAKPGWFDPKSGYQTAILLNAIAQTGSPPPDLNPRWDFQELIEGGTLPYLLHSSHFAAAAEYAGRDVDTVRAEVISALAPTRGMYHDGVNGELDW